MVGAVGETASMKRRKSVEDGGGWAVSALSSAHLKLGWISLVICWIVTE